MHGYLEVIILTKLNRCIKLFAAIAVTIAIFGCDVSRDSLSDIPISYNMHTNNLTGDITNSQPTNSAEYYTEEIQNYLDRFMSLFSSNQIFFEELDVLDISSEGAGIWRYIKSDDDTVLRYRADLYGELGNVKYNYYLLPEYVYIQVLETWYSNPISFFEETGNYIDIRNYALIEYILFSDNSCYILDKYNQQLIRIEEDRPFIPVDEVEGYFVEQN